MNLHRPWIPELIQHNLPANLLDQEGNISRVSDALFDLREILLLDTSASFTKHFRAEVYSEYLEYVNTHRATTSLEDYLTPPSSLADPSATPEGNGDSEEDYEEFDNFEGDSEEDYEEFDNFEGDSEEDYEEFDNFEGDSEEDYEEFDNFEGDSEEDYEEFDNFEGDDDSEEFDVFENLDNPQPVFRPAPSSTISSPHSTPSPPLTPATRLEKGLVGAFDTVSSFFRK